MAKAKGFGQLLGAPVSIDFPWGPAFVRSPPIGEILELGAGLSPGALIAATVVDDAGQSVFLSAVEAEAWANTAPASEVVVVVDTIHDAIGFGADVEEVAEWMHARPLLRVAIRIAITSRRSLSTVLAMPLGHLRLIEAAQLLDKIDKVGQR